MPVDQALRQAELEADLANFVFEQISQWLDQGEAEVLGQAADVVVRLDAGSALTRGGGGALNDVRVERSLYEKVDLTEAPGFFVKDRDELVADPPSLLFRIFNACQPI